MSQQTSTRQRNGLPVVTARVFSENYHRCHGRLVNSMATITRNRGEAEDIAATAYARAFQERNRFRGDSSLATWIHGIALNEASNRRRRRQAVSLESIGAASSTALWEPDLLAETLERSERCGRIRLALSRVPLIYRQVLVDHFVRGLALKDIAQCRRIPVGTALSRLFKAKRLLRNAWGA